MKRRTLGRTGIEVSEIGVGTWQLAGPLTLDGRPDGHPDVGEARAVAIIHRAEALGVNFIDLAEQYGDGEAERRAGKALAGRRERWVVCTKFGALVGPGGRRVRDVSARRVPLSLEGSLRRLRTDYIDVYLYHQPPDPAEAEAVAAYLERAREQGKVRAVGISTRRLADCELLRRVGQLDVVEYHSNLLDPNEPFRAFIREHGLGGIVRGALAGGRLSGRYVRRPPRFAPDDLRSAWFEAEEEAARDFARFRALEALVTPERSMAQLALRYLLDLPETHTIALGAKREEDYEAACRAAALPPLAEEERARAEAIAATLR